MSVGSENAILFAGFFKKRDDDGDRDGYILGFLRQPLLIFVNKALSAGCEAPVLS